ncbi:MAG: hypothetical protein P8L40_06510 [Planktomarina sp.]|nr:hypothetical protein [Planktomarina sp.]
MFGTDYEAYIPGRNEILLSTPTGYKAGYLPGSALHNHGGAAGDIDSDSDVDIIESRHNETGVTTDLINFY